MIACLATFAVTCFGWFLIAMSVQRACPRCDSRRVVTGNTVCYCYACDLTWERDTWKTAVS